MAAGQMIAALLRFGVGALFVYAGAVKIADPQQFALDVHHYQLTSFTVSVLVATYLPWLEFCAGLALIARRFTLGAPLALAGMMLAFIAALASAWMRGLDIACGCFGREADAIRTNFPALIARDAVLFAAVLVLLVIEARRPPPPSDRG